MVHIEVFDNFEEMQKRMEEQLERAKSWIRPRQAAITYGDYWMRVWDAYGDRILICGYIHTLDEVESEERRIMEEDDESREEIEAEMAYERQVMSNSYANGFRFGRAYSVIEPSGELGDTHVSQMIPITKEEFEECKSLNWVFEEVMYLPWFRTAVERLQ
jgi:hypothetical protein